MSDPALPFERSYWVDPGRLLAGIWPGDPDPRESARRLGRLLDCDIRTLIDLTECGELELRSGRFRTYAPELERLAAARGLQTTCLRFEIADSEAPGIEGLDRVLAAIEESLGAGRPSYLHCWGGRGRTGLVAGAYLIARGRATAESFVSELARLRQHIPTPGDSPQTPEQCAFVRRWAAQRQ